MSGDASQDAELGTYRIHDFLTVETNVDLQIPEFHRVSPESALQEPRLRIEETTDRSAVAPDEGAVAFADGTLRLRPDGTGSDAAISVSGLEADRTTIRWTPAFRRHHDYMSVYEGALTAKLLDRDVAVVHAAGIERDGNGLLLASMGRMGKTTTTLNVLDAVPSAGFLSDNLLFVDRSGTAYAYPATPVVFPGTKFDRRQLGPVERVALWGRRTVARSELGSALLLHRYGIDLSQSILAEEYAERVVASAPVSELVLLNGGRAGPSERTHTPASAVPKIATGTDMELEPGDDALSQYALRAGVPRIHASSIKRRRHELLVDALDSVPLSELFRNDIADYADALVPRLRNL
ncbi:hypothetical protein [Haloplanus pelagicus]|uniref:hypothetical protein n=1 Tax=Haloplanus pelagicus TaxID=2949995 RepID=UPI00203C9412|nr:hypothetical protein [Haloplanus sp. HW8-1]